MVPNFCAGRRGHQLYHQFFFFRGCTKSVVSKMSYRMHSEARSILQINDRGMLGMSLSIPKQACQHVCAPQGMRFELQTHYTWPS